MSYVVHAVFYEPYSVFYFNPGRILRTNFVKKYFADWCSKLTLVDVFGHISWFLNFFQLKLRQLL